MELLRTTARSSRRRGTVGGDEGVTLIEVVVAMVVMLVLASTVLGLVITAQKQSIGNRNRVAASNLAAREIEFVREQFLATSSGPLDVANAGVRTNAHPLAGGTSGAPLVIDGAEYTVEQSSAWNPTGTSASACDGGGLVNHPTLIVSVRVTWPGMGTITPVTNTAVLAPERGIGLDTTAAFAAVSVKDAAGQPSPFRHVTVYSTTENVSGVTDMNGCAVIALAPPTAGSSYTAKFTDAGYVDITRTEFPERSIGVITPGTLSSSSEISLDRAATVTIQVTGTITAAEAAGSTVSLYQSEASGSSIIPITLTGLSTLVTNLWPTDYTAFFGSKLPSTMPAMVTLAPGATGTLSVPFLTADFVVTGVPAVSTAGTEVVAAPPSGSCTDPTAKVITPSAGHLVAGTWSFWLRSAALGCSEGPSSVALEEGPNPDVAWASSTLSISGAPSGPVWASPGASGGSCSATNAQKISDVGGNLAPVSLAAGDWYIFSAPGGSSPGTPCKSAGLVAVPYGTASTLSWPAMTSTVTVGNVSYAAYSTIFASLTRITVCDKTSSNGTGVVAFTYGSNSFTATLPAGTWYLHRGSAYNSCQAWGANPLTVSGSTSYSVDFDRGRVTTP